MKNYSIKTDLTTLSKVMKIFQECNLLFLITGDTIKEEDLDQNKLIIKLFAENKLVELLSIITGEKQEELNNIDIGDAFALVVDFFGDIGKKFNASISKIMETVRKK